MTRATMPSQAPLSVEAHFAAPAAVWHEAEPLVESPAARSSCGVSISADVSVAICSPEAQNSRLLAAHVVVTRRRGYRGV